MVQRPSLHVKKGDTVQVISGKDKGKVGEIIKILRQKNQVVIQEVNIKKKHLKSKKEGESGRIVQRETPIDSSNVMLYNKEEKLASRTAMRINSDGSKTRIFKKLLH
uniref:Ribosomal protein L24 n=1 Tax=Cryptomonas sp. SAG 977-2f TaxID=279061 RepID=A0A679CA61_9CRYP|nr:ribosomal protein L24 [Cryptomonas sp. SAG 977-2f]